MVNRGEFIQDEAKYGWLSILLDAYSISDRLMTDRLSLLSRQGVSIVCQKGCYACCLKPAVPITLLELMGISWYASEKLSGNLRLEVKRRLFAHADSSECPFLVGGCCAIYPVRPLICRQFHVKSKRCANGEDVFYTRPEDIVAPSRQIAKDVSFRVFDFYGIEGARRKEEEFEDGFIVENSRLMYQCDLSTIGQTMDLLDTKTQ